MSAKQRGADREEEEGRVHVRARMPSGISWLSGFTILYPESQSPRVPIKPRFFALSPSSEGS